MEGMPLRDRLYMLPVERYEKYGKYPWRLLIDVLLLVFTTSQLLLIVTPNNIYAQNQLRLWEKVLVPDPPQIYSVAELQKMLQKTISNFKKIDRDSFGGNYTLMDEISLHAYEYDNISKVIHEKVTEEDLGSINKDAMKFLHSVVHFYLEFKVDHTIPKGRCFSWTLMQRFNFEHSGPMTVSMDSQYEACNAQILHLPEKYGWLHVVVMLLAILAFIMTIRSFFTRIDIVAEIRGDNPSKLWSHLEISEKLRFFPLWLLVTTVGNLSQFFGSVLAFVDVSMVHSQHAGLMGLGCFCSWVSIIRYFEGASELYTLTNTVRRAGRILLLFYTGVAPVFIGYVMLGMSFLTGTGYFNDVPSAIAALYAVMCGDNIYDLFMASMDTAGFFGGLYVLSFIIFFIACVHNIFIAIIQEAFYSLKTKPPRRGDESSEEDVPKAKPEGVEIARMESKKKSRHTFKRLITREEPLLSQDEEQRNTEDTLHKLNRLHEETAALIHSLESAGKPTERVDQAAVDEKLKAVKGELSRLLGP